MEFTKSNYQDELQSMFDALPKFAYALATYMSHRLRVKIQFHAIDKIKQEELKIAQIRSYL